MNRTAENKCCECGHTWRDLAGVERAEHKTCPECGSAYWKWLDYEQA